MLGWRILMVPLLGLLVFSGGGAPAYAKRKPRKKNLAAKKYAGQVLLLKRRPPRTFTSQRQLLAFLKKSRLTSIWPIKGKRAVWRLVFMAFLKAPARDVELRVKFFDVTAQRRFVAGDTIFTSDKEELIIQSSITLEEPKFVHGRKYMIALTDSRNYVLAKGTFWLKGKAERFSGKVTFSEGETK